MVVGTCSRRRVFATNVACSSSVCEVYSDVAKSSNRLVFFCYDIRLWSNVTRKTLK